LGGFLLRTDLDDFFGFRIPSVQRDSFVGTWEPRVDIKETDDEITISAELPRIDRKDIKVEVNDGVLSLSGQKKTESKDDKNIQAGIGVITQDTGMNEEQARQLMTKLKGICG